MNAHGPGRLRLLALTTVVLLVLAPGCQIVGDAQATVQPTATAAVPAPNAPVAVAATPTVPAPLAAAPTPPAPLVTTDLSVAIRQVAERLKPAVVQITNQQVQVDQFNQPFTVPAGVGSGVIYDAEGHVLTNNHVVEGAERLLVSLPDGRSFEGTLVGRDPQTDLAVVKIAGEDLPVAQLGDSRRLQVGDWVVAIGNALGLPGGPTVTAGVVSALDRTVQTPPGSPAQGAYLFGVIQTDAPINPGNSGGPLANLAGEVVGINTMVAGRSDTGVPVQGIGFAIAIATARPVADQLVATGRVVHPYMGVNYQPLNPAIAAQMGIQQRNGVLVLRVVPGSPASRTDLQARDIIVEVDGVALQGESAFAEAISRGRPGDTITLTVLRGNERLTMQATLGERTSS